MAISSRITLLGALALWAFQAQAVDVTVAYQTSAEPAKVAQADNTFAKASGANVDWRKFDSGASVVRGIVGMGGGAERVPARWRWPPASRCRLKSSCWRRSSEIPKRWW